MGYIMWLGKGYGSLAPETENMVNVDTAPNRERREFATLFGAFHQQRIGVSPAKLCALTDRNWVLPTKTSKKSCASIGEPHWMFPPMLASECRQFKS